MAGSRRLLALSLGLVWLIACSERGPTDVPSAVAEAGHPQAGHGGGPAAVEIGGPWSWSSEEHLTFPDWVAVAIFGIQPEGPTMTARCENEGTLSLNQTGAGFVGELLLTAHDCVTRGGQGFQDPGAFAPRAVVDGLLRGRALSMVLDGPLVDCPFHGVISEIEGTAALALEGGGRCLVPGHPRSEASFPPPPAGTSKTLSWRATRS